MMVGSSATHTDGLEHEEEKQKEKKAFLSQSHISASLWYGT